MLLCIFSSFCFLLKGGSRQFVLACANDDEMYEWEKSLRRGSERAPAPLNVKKHAHFEAGDDFHALINTSNPLDKYESHWECRRLFLSNALVEKGIIISKVLGRVVSAACGLQKKEQLEIWWWSR